MKILVKIAKIYGKKDGTPYILLGVYDDVSTGDAKIKSVNDLISDKSDKNIFVGTSYEEVIIAQASLSDGTIEVDGSLELGKEVRVFKEGEPARVTYIKVKK